MQEVEAFTDDVKKLVEFIKPYVVKTVDVVKTTFNKIKTKFSK